jgi:hypothetical protein
MNKDKSYDLLKKVHDVFVGEKFENILPVCLFGARGCANNMGMPKEDLLEMMGKIMDLPDDPADLDPRIAKEIGLALKSAMEDALMAWHKATTKEEVLN